jgi:hypothetical protein
MQGLKSRTVAEFWRWLLELDPDSWLNVDGHKAAIDYGFDGSMEIRYPSYFVEPVGKMCEFIESSIKHDLVVPDQYVLVAKRVNYSYRDRYAVLLGWSDGGELLHTYFYGSRQVAVEKAMELRCKQ